MSATPQTEAPEPLCIGLLGGMSPESTADYYLRIVHLHHEKTGNHAYPRILIAGISFQPIIEWMHEGRFDEIGRVLQEEIEDLEGAGAELIAIASNSVHKSLPYLRPSKPLLPIFDAIAREAHKRGAKTVGLTGTLFTMADGFYQEALAQRGLETVTPPAAQQQEIHEMIFDELVMGKVTIRSRSLFGGICEGLLSRGADAVILGCTELGLLRLEAEVAGLCLDSAEAHAKAIWEISMGIS